MAGLPDGEGVDALAAAEIVASPARARGRPLGAANRKNGDLIRYLQARGHRDPMVTLSMIQSADFKELCKISARRRQSRRSRCLASSGARRPT
ncbi:hypothetical protein NKH24_29510 [Mesorhizobium sp. M1300]|uniref:hypothetical protein n=1 Tax=Mesorhizobium sp. M1300 TaxID=2957077 RepID=UPI003339B102